MENKIYTEDDNFEQLLKEVTDNFRMYPSKRVWHSIYNDLHPGRKWPSLAVWLLLISSITFIGLSNKNKTTAESDNINKAIGGVNADVFTSSDYSVAEKNPVSSNNQQVQYTTVNKLQQISNSNDLTNTKSIHVTTANIGSVKLNDREKATIINDISNGIPAKNILANSATPVAKSTTEDIPSPGLNKSIVTNSIVNSKQDITIANNINSSTTKVKEADKKNGLLPEKPSVILDKEWIEDYALHNKPSSSKWKTRVTYQVYATPSIGYRSLDKTANYDLSNSSSLVANNNNNYSDINNAINQSAAFNMEAGGGILYSFSKIIRFKAGLQFNYTSYTINANELKHPTSTTLLVNDINNDYPELVSRSATLSNAPGVSPKKINNNTYQISLPIGADVKLAGQNRLQWFAGVTLQPSFVAGGNSYLLSADLKNYVSDPSFLRKWNLNAGVETFLSYKTKSGVILNAGPQLRYQLLSTYSKQYTFSEKLYNLGLKIGITTSF